MEILSPTTHDSTSRTVHPPPFMYSQQRPPIPFSTTTPSTRQTPVPRSNNVETLKSWSHLFRPSFSQGPTPSTPQSSQSQSMDSQTTFTFCQNRLLSATEDLGKIVQNVANSFGEDKRNLEGMIGEARALIEGVKQENMARHDRNMNDIDGQLTSVRRIVDTVSDLNAVIMAKLGKVEGVLERVVDMSLKLERRMDSMGKELVDSERATKDMAEDTVKTESEITSTQHPREVQSPPPEESKPDVVDLTTTSQLTPAKHSLPSTPKTIRRSPNVLPSPVEHSSPGLLTLKLSRGRPPKSTKSSPAKPESPYAPPAPRRQTRAMAKRKKLSEDDNDWEEGVWDMGVNDIEKFQKVLFRGD